MTNELLLQRVLIRRAGADSSRLVSVARDIFTEVVSAAVRRDLMRDYQVDYADVVGLLNCVVQMCTNCLYSWRSTGYEALLY